MLICSRGNVTVTSDTMFKVHEFSKNYQNALRKIVIRRLPPDLDFQTLKKLLSPLPEYDYIYFVKADKSYGKNAFSRAYINFIFEEDLYIFKEKFDDYVFLSSKGIEYRVVVEFAPFQRIPKERPYRKKDIKMGSIESCPYYKEFVHSLKKSNLESFKSLNILSFSYPKKSCDEKTPLLKYISDRKKLKTEDKKDDWKYSRKNFKDGSTCIFVNSSVKKESFKKMW